MFNLNFLFTIPYNYSKISRFTSVLFMRIVLSRSYREFFNLKLTFAVSLKCLFKIGQSQGTRKFRVLFYQPVTKNLPRDDKFCPLGKVI